MDMQEPFDTIIGHASARACLDRGCSNPHAGYLLHGPAHVGKRMLARQFVARLLESDLTVFDGVHPDLIILQPPEGKTMVSVEDVRRARARLIERPMIASRVVCYIPSLDRLNEEGWNALLKIFEEPPRGVVFVCVCENPGMIPGTVLSRVVSLSLNPVAEQEIVDGLIARGIPEKDARQLAIAAHGRPGLAIEPPVENLSRDAEDFLKARSLGAALAVVERVHQRAESAADASEMWRAIILAWMQTVETLFHSDPSRAFIVGQGVCSAHRLIGHSVSPRLALEALAIKLHATPSVVNTAATVLPSNIPTSTPYPFSIL